MAAATATHTVTSPVAGWHAARLSREPEAIRLYDRLSRGRNPLGNLGSKARPNQALLKAAGVDYDTYITLMACYPHKNAAEWVLAQSDIPDEAFQALACIPDMDWLVRIILSGKAPQFLLAHLAEHPSANVRTEVTYTNSTLPVSVQQLLARDPDHEVRGQLAERHDLDPEVLNVLAQDSNESVVDTAIENPRLPLDTLRGFLTQVAQLNPRGPLPTWTYTLLNTAMRRKRSDLIAQVVEVVTAHEITELWPEILSNPKTPMSVLREKSAQVRSLPMASKAALASNPKTPVETLEWLATKKNANTRAGLASNPSTPTHILSELAHFTNDNDLLYRLATNPSTPGEVLTWIGLEQECPEGCCHATHDYYTITAAWKNPNMPLSAVTQAPAYNGVLAMKNHRNIPEKTLMGWFTEVKKEVTQEFKRLELGDDEDDYDYYWNDVPGTLGYILDYPGSPTETMLKKLVAKHSVPPLQVYALRHSKMPTDALLPACMHRLRTIRKAALAHPACPEEGRVAASLIALSDQDEYDD